MLNFCLTISVMFTHILAAPCGGGCGSNNQILKSGVTTAENLVQSSSNVTVKQPQRRRKCCPYDFDSRLCQVVGDRILCGFNRNIGRPAGGYDSDRELSGGCRIRRGRLECGYDGEGPFVHVRRPPAWNQNLDDIDDKLSDELINNKVEKLALSNINQLKYIIPSTTKKADPSKCVEISERIVCKNDK